MGKKTFQLGPVDYVFTGSGSQPITFAFYYPKRLDPNILQKSLKETLDKFPILTSKLQRRSKNEFEYLIADDGITFEIRRSEIPFDDLQNIDLYISPVTSTDNDPLTQITVTQIPQGTVLAASISHALVDGFSYFHFLSSWARICRRGRMLDPDLNRGAWSSFNIPEEKSISAKDIYKNCGLFWEGKRPENQKNPVQEERLFLSKTKIRSQMEEAKKTHPGLSLFENDIITALLWKKFLPKWVDNMHNPATYLTIPFDFRRVYSGLSRNYFGCAICFATVSADLNTLKEKSIGELAVLINRTIRQVNQAYVTDFLQTLADLRRQQGISVFEEIHLRHPKNGLIVTNLTRMPIRDLDFGSGTPSNFLAYVDVHGGAAILAAEDGVEVLISPPDRRIGVRS